MKNHKKAKKDESLESAIEDIVRHKKACLSSDTPEKKLIVALYDAALEYYENTKKRAGKHLKMPAMKKKEHGGHGKSAKRICF